jgi:hypothetical protein
MFFQLKKREPRVYLLVGVTGSGKSTTGNCLYNKSGELKMITESPFETSSGASGCTTSFKCVEKDGNIIIDTIGFADKKQAADRCLKDIMKALEHPKVNSKVDCVLFLVRAGRFSDEIVEFFTNIQVRILERKCLKNSMLIVTGCRELDWVKKQKNNEFLEQALENCSKLYFEFNLKFDDEQDDEDDRVKNVDKRQRAINQLIEYIEEQSFQKVDLKFVEKAVEEDLKRKKDLEKMKTIKVQPLRVTPGNIFE